jgi:hypothetical protein
MKNTIKHVVFSQDQDIVISFFEKFNREAIKQTIVGHLKAFPSDTLEHCKEYSERDTKKYYGYEIINFYAVNPKNGQPSKVVTVGDREYYRALN